MDDKNTQEQQNNAEQGDSRPHVRLFGAEVNSGDGDWRKRKDEWKQQHREQRDARREQWRMQRREWHDDHHRGSGIFWGLILLFAGVIALLYTTGIISHPFWQAIAPFWPILLIMWGASIILGRHWFTRFILFLFALAFLIIVIFYGLVRSDSPLVGSLSPNVVRAVQNVQAP